MLIHVVFTELISIKGSPSENFLPVRIFAIKFNVTLVAKTVNRHISTPKGHSSSCIGSIMGFYGMPLLLVTILITEHQYL